MSHYSDDAASVRVDFFQKYGKWYCTEAVKWTGSWKDGVIQQELRKSLADHFGTVPRLQGMWAVCLHPYHKNEHPMMILVDEQCYIPTTIEPCKQPPS